MGEYINGNATKFKNLMIEQIEAKMKAFLAPAGKFVQIAEAVPTRLFQREGNKKDAGKACVVDDACKSGACEGGICGKLCSDGCSRAEFCDTRSYSSDICRPKESNGYSPCFSDAQCESGRCDDRRRECKSPCE